MLLQATRAAKLRTVLADRYLAFLSIFAISITFHTSSADQSSCGVGLLNPGSAPAPGGRLITLFDVLMRPGLSQTKPSGFLRPCTVCFPNQLLRPGVNAAWFPESEFGDFSNIFVKQMPYPVTLFVDLSRTLCRGRNRTRGRTCIKAGMTILECQVESWKFQPITIVMETAWVFLAICLLSVNAASLTVRTA